MPFFDPPLLIAPGDLGHERGAKPVELVQLALAVAARGEQIDIGGGERHEAIGLVEMSSLR